MLKNYGKSDRIKRDTFFIPALPLTSYVILIRTPYLSGLQIPTPQKLEVGMSLMPVLELRE